MKKAVIFDLDGTLADTLSSITYFANEALKTYGLSPISKDRYRYLVGNGAAKLVQGMLKESGDPELQLYHQVSQLYNSSYDENPLFLASPYPGILDLLQQLSDHGIKTAVLSNKPHSTTVQIVRQLFPQDQISLCFGQREGIPRKPDPAGVFAILKEWNLKPEDCLYVGDTCTDMQTGHNAGITTVGVLWGFRDRAELEENHADHIIAEPSQLLPLCLD